MLSPVQPPQPGCGGGQFQRRVVCRASPRTTRATRGLPGDVSGGGDVGGWASLPQDIARLVFMRVLTKTAAPGGVDDRCAAETGTPDALFDADTSGSEISSICGNSPPVLSIETATESEREVLASARLVCRSWAYYLSGTIQVLRPSHKRTPKHWVEHFPEVRALDLTRAKRFRIGNSDMQSKVVQWFEKLKRSLDEGQGKSLSKSQRGGCSPMVGLKLEQLFAANRRLNANGAAIIGSLTSLTTLDLADSVLSDAAVAELRPLSKLKSLKLKGSHKISEGVLLDTLRNYPHLQELNLMCCHRAVTNTQLERLQIAGLRSLNLRGCDRLTAEGLQHLTRFTQLESLDVGCLSHLDNKTLANISRLPCLKHLDIRAASKVTDDGLIHLSKLTSLNSLSFAHCHSITAFGVEDLFRYDNPLPNLRSLDLSWGPMLKDTALIPIAKLTQLQTLKLRHCSAVTDEGVDILSVLTSLTHLDCGSCTGLSDVGMSNLTSLHKLHRLELAVCDNLTDKGISSLHPLLHLEHLDLRCCVQLSDRTVDTLLRFPSLKSVDLRLCHGIAKPALGRIKHLLEETPF